MWEQVFLHDTMDDGVLDLIIFLISKSNNQVVVLLSGHSEGSQLYMRLQIICFV
jgi:hypothetical protein